MDCSASDFPVYRLAQTHVHWFGDAIQPSHPPLSPSPPAFNLSQHHQSFQCIFRVDFLKDWVVECPGRGILKRFLQQHNSKASVLQHLAFFMVQLSYPYMTTGKIIALTRWTFVCKVMSVSLEGFIASHTAASPRIYSLNPYFPPLDGPCILKY